MNFNLQWNGGNGGAPFVIPDGAQFYDAQAAMSFVISQTSFIEQQINRIVYPEIQYPNLVPVDTSADPFAKTVTYYSSDMFGRANWINLNADDIPLAGTELTKFETQIHSAAVGYGYGYEEVQQAMRVGYALQSEDARAARFAAEQFVDRVAMYGDARKNFFGMINHPAVTPQNAPTGDWLGTGANFQSILRDLNSSLLISGSNTLYGTWGNTILLPHEHLAFLSETIIPGTATPLLAYVREQNAYTQTTGQPLTIRAVRGLETAGVGQSARMVIYRRDPSVLKLHYPMPHRFMPVWQAGPLRWEVPGIMRVGGLDVRRPKEVLYIDGI